MFPASLKPRPANLLPPFLGVYVQSRLLFNSVATEHPNTKPGNAHFALENRPRLFLPGFNLNFNENDASSSKNFAHRLDPQRPSRGPIG
jgi:hypothetical protein